MTQFRSSTDELIAYFHFSDEKVDLIAQIMNDAFKATQGTIPDMITFLSEREKDPIIFGFMVYTLGTTLTESEFKHEMKGIVKAAMIAGAQNSEKVLALTQSEESPSPSPGSEPEHPGQYQSPSPGDPMYR